MRRFLLSLALVGMSLTLPGGTLAQTGGDYDLSWSTVDGGGVTSRGGDYTLIGTAGQPDAGSSQGEDYTLSGGFLGGAAGSYEVYIPLVLRDR